MQTLYVPKNAVPSTRNLFGKFRNSNEVLALVLTNLRPVQVARE